MVGLAGVAASALDDVLGVLLHVIGEGQQGLLSLRWGGALPVGECGGRGGVGLVDVVIAGNRSRAVISPVDGSTMGIVAPLAESTSSPLMKFLTVVATAPESLRWEFAEGRERVGKNVKTLVEQLVADRQRRQEPQNVAERRNSAPAHPANGPSRTAPW